MKIHSIIKLKIGLVRFIYFSRHRVWEEEETVIRDGITIQPKFIEGTPEMETRSKQTFVATLIAISLGLAASSAAAKVTTCEASWYGPGFQGNRMANGRRFNMDDPTVVAHKSYPFGTILRVTNLNNNKTIDVIVQDRGPYKRGRCVDLSRAAAKRIGVYTGPYSGTAPVKVEVIGSNKR